MSKKYFNFDNSQVGDGDICLISHIMTRLTMAKVLQKFNVDLTNFVFCREYNTQYGFYTVEERIADIVEFLDLLGADYSIDEEELILSFPMEIECSSYEDELSEALLYMWSYAEWGDEELVSAKGNDLIIKIDNYYGVPTQFFVSYGALMEDYIK